MNKIKHVLISRTDNIGDVILTLPLAGILKEKLPDVRVSFLARDYTRSVIEACAHVDAFYSVDHLQRLTPREAIAALKAEKFDVVIHVLPNPTIAKYMYRAGVPIRIGTSRRWYHWLTCNKRVALERAGSPLHEAQLNAQLLSPLGFKGNNALDALQSYIGMKRAEAVSETVRSYLHPNKFNMIIHPFSNGHTREWPISHFNALIRQLPSDRVHVIVTGSKQEALKIEQRMASQLPQLLNAAGQLSLTELWQLISHVDGLIANSTGPLHMAAAAGIHVLGLYPCTPGLDARRWAPLGEKVALIEANPNCTAPACRAINDCICMESITVDAAKAHVMQWLRN